MHQSTGNFKKILFYLFSLFFLSSIVNLEFKSINDKSFLIEKIQIISENKSLENKLSKQLNYLINQNILLLEKKRIIEKIKSNKIIQDFKVIKKYPSEILIYAVSTKIIGKTLIEGNLYYIGYNSKLIEDVNQEIPEDLPNIFGKFELDDFLSLYKELQKNNFENYLITDFYYFENNRWDIKINNGLLIKLPEKNNYQTLKMVKKLLDNNTFEQKIIDLRVANQVIISNG